MRRSKLAIAVMGILGAFSAEAGTFVLQAAHWGPQQDRAVANAGGKVTSSSKGAGVAVVESSNPGFLAAVLAGGAVTSGAADMTVEWVDPVVMEIDQAAINPLNDRFYPVQWAPQAIEAPAAWAMGFTGNGIRIAVIDGGIHAAHQDLSARMDVGASKSFVLADPLATPAVNNCRTAYNCDTGTFWHGTHVAGIIAASDNTLGTVGIAPEATIVGAKALHNGSGSFGSVIAAILYAADQSAAGGRAHIINMSLGALFAKNESGASALRNALSSAVKEASKTTLVVVAAGNDGLSMDGSNLTVTPAESGPAMVVSATGPLGFALGATDFSRPSSYTNYGNSLVHVGGPGGDFALPGTAICAVPPVVSQCWVFDMVLSTTRGGPTSTTSYGFAAGTSMAAPAVAAVAALALQKHPGLSPDALRKHLENTSTNVLGNNSAFHGRGFINAKNAVSN